jgi:hypothetical protein
VASQDHLDDVPDAARVGPNDLLEQQKAKEAKEAANAAAAAPVL